MVSHDFRLISQVAEQLWEVKDKKIKDLSKEDVDMYVFRFPRFRDRRIDTSLRYSIKYKNMLINNSRKAIEQAKLVS